MPNGPCILFNQTQIVMILEWLFSSLRKFRVLGCLVWPQPSSMQARSTIWVHSALWLLPHAALPYLSRIRQPFLKLSMDVIAEAVTAMI